MKIEPSEPKKLYAYNCEHCVMRGASSDKFITCPKCNETIQPFPYLEEYLHCNDCGELYRVTEGHECRNIKRSYKHVYIQHPNPSIDGMMICWKCGESGFTRSNHTYALLTEKMLMKNLTLSNEEIERRIANGEE